METTEQFWTQTRWGLQGEDGAVRWRVKEQEQEPGVRRAKEQETGVRNVQEQEPGVRRVREQEQDSCVRRVKEPVKAERRARSRCKEEKRSQLGGFASLSVDSLEVETVRKTLVDSLEMETVRKTLVDSLEMETVRKTLADSFEMETEDDTERNTEINRRAHSLMDRQTGQSVVSQGQSGDSETRLESKMILPPSVLGN